MAWDKNKIAEGVLAPDLNNEIRINWAALEAALDAWIRFETGGTQTGQPRQGSARPYFQDSAPTARLDGDYFESTDLGTIWIDTNTSPDNQFNFLSAADGAGTETWTPISTEIIAVLLAANRIFAGTLKSTGDFTVGANKVVITAANGNTAIAGTLDVTGNIDPTSYETTKGGFLDEDAMGSNAANKVASQQSIKAYIAAQIAANQDSTYSGGESHTFKGGLIMKMGTFLCNNAAPKTLTFGTAFPNAIVSATVTMRTTTSAAYPLRIESKSTANLVIDNINVTGTYYAEWIAIGH